VSTSELGRGFEPKKQTPPECNCESIAGEREHNSLQRLCVQVRHGRADKTARKYRAVSILLLMRGTVLTRKVAINAFIICASGVTQVDRAEESSDVALSVLGRLLSIAGY
jgi:hypothetical protein